MKLGTGLALAGISAGALNWGFFAQHTAAQTLPRLLLRKPLRSLRLLFTSPRWLAGYVTGIGGWALYIAALVLAPLSLVQATSAGGIGLLALLVARSQGSPLESRERVGVAAALAGLSLLGLSLAGQSLGSDRGSVFAIASWVAVSAALAGLAVRPIGRSLAPGAGYGTAAGLLYAAGDVATKAAVSGGGRLTFLVVMAACHGTAFVSLQIGFQRGRALPTAGVSNVLSNALPIAAGVVLFHEIIPLSALGALRVAAFGGVVLAASLLVGIGPNGPADGVLAAGPPEANVPFTRQVHRPAAGITKRGTTSSPRSMTAPESGFSGSTIGSTRGPRSSSSTTCWRSSPSGSR